MFKDYTLTIRTIFSSIKIDVGYTHAVRFNPSHSDHDCFDRYRQHIQPKNAHGLSNTGSINTCEELI